MTRDVGGNLSGDATRTPADEADVRRERDPREGGGGFAAPISAGMLPPSGIIASVPFGSESPLAALSMSTGNVTTTNTVKKFLNFTASNNSKIFRVNPADTTQIHVGGAFAAFLILGAATWAIDANGRRLMTLEPFSNTGAALSTINLFNMPGNIVANPNVIPIAFGYASVGAAYFKVSVTQNAGGDLQVNVNLTIAVL